MANLDRSSPEKSPQPIPSPEELLKTGSSPYVMDGIEVRTLKVFVNVILVKRIH